MGTTSQLVAVIDDESILRATKRLLRSQGIEADTFIDGGTFLERLAANPSYHRECVILDMESPGLNGPSGPAPLAGTGTPIIFITASDDIAARQTVLTAGAIARFPKPCDRDALVRTVQGALGGTTHRGASPEAPTGQ
ncbi:FixJ family two-component response regulator [Paraburkholderia sp. UCT70]|uniref:response regulator n=1 Tax=Paraburkholderia sp. UCT70 TaxID=2991068 RepID=UPI003D21BF27